MSSFGHALVGQLFGGDSLQGDDNFPSLGDTTAKKQARLPPKEKPLNHPNPNPMPTLSRSESEISEEGRAAFNHAMHFASMGDRLRLAGFRLPADHEQQQQQQQQQQSAADTLAQRLRVGSGGSGRGGAGRRGDRGAAAEAEFADAFSRSMRLLLSDDGQQSTAAPASIGTSE